MDALFTPKTLSFLQEAIGGLETLKNKKVLTSSFVLSLSEDLEDLRIASREEDCLNPPEDNFLFMFLRAYFASLLATVSVRSEFFSKILKGKTLREEENFSTAEPPTFSGHIVEIFNVMF